MKKSILLVVAVTTLLGTGCKKRYPCIIAKADTVEESRTVNDFSKVDLKIAADVYIVQDTTLTSDKVTIVASDNVLDHIETNIKGTTLEIDSKRCIRGEGNITVYVSTNDLLGISISGSGDVYVQNKVNSSSMDLDIAGSGSISMDVACLLVETNISGSGDIDLSGSTDNLKIKISGSGDVDAYGLPTKTAEINISGSGESKINVAETLNVKISGSGNVYYLGKPNIYQDISGSGSIINEN